MKIYSTIRAGFTAAAVLLSGAVSVGAQDVSTTTTIVNGRPQIYVGVLIGYDVGTATLRDSGYITGWDTSVPFSQTGFSGSLVGGLQMRSGALLYGMEGDLGLARDSGKISVLGDSASVSNTYRNSIRGRVGYDLNDRAMVFATAGWAWSNAELKVVSNGVSESETQALRGGVWGAGVELKLAQSVPILWRTEFLRYEFGHKDFSLGGSTTRLDLSTNVVRTGLVLPF